MCGELTASTCIFSDMLNGMKFPTKGEKGEECIQSFIKTELQRQNYKDRITQTELQITEEIPKDPAPGQTYGCYLSTERVVPA